MAQQNDSFPSDRKKGSGEPPKQLTVTERAELKSNQLQQALGLDEAQHKQVLKLYKKLFRNEESDKESQGMDGGPGFGNTGPGASGIERPSGMGGRGGFGGAHDGEGPGNVGGQRHRPPVEDIVKQAEERFEKAQKKMQKILTAEQYQQWVKLEQKELAHIIKQEGNKKFQRHGNSNRETLQEP